ncbi:unnamed protein product [Rotaria socialis]|uniref:Lipocalin/cytosolic fatty-acid binding domain-containing protein n=1 Tax=Rotaria socialis TaxID=392032 RepID=A0A818LUA3_9BILA|nr:unnamed protein product [Rotaria socialis]CAF3295189.1 unnamed protein product [Rotaria socialis]CAF3380915.1 unnamed protein product [Rotaria socialis]CAF3577832.1 unnamed protein product [Rotaria socialis]CAF3614553.1 unnamed protein product [Rotaria socialis]
MAQNNSIEALIDTWDYADGDNMDEYLKELGIGMMGRMMAKQVKPRLIITETDGKWTLRTETTFKTTVVEFTPGVEYNETTADGRELKGIIQFDDGKWIQKMHDKNGKLSMITRWIDEKDQQQIILECGTAKVHRFYRRAQ